ncbi:hypothetical protein [Terrimonas ferruginea]|uniref:hypothetical protein n=1 Tax=Terrimonas ferruginea TaxID=249 RepID=UPI00048AD79D|nr:hypothetical protein [Terrimonas ferruginea]
MKRLFIHIFLTGFLLAGAVVVRAQQATRVKASVDKSKIMIGEPFTLTLEAQIPVNEPIRFFSIDTIPHFEFLQKGKTDTTDKGGGTVLRQELQLTSFDSGAWVIPAMVLSAGIATDSLPVDVTFSDPFNPEAPYNPIHDILDAEPVKESADPTWLWYLGGSVLLLIILLWYFLSRRKPAPAKPAVVLTPYEKAIEALQRLKQSSTDSRNYHITLGELFRSYVSERRQLPTLQQTTDEVMRQLKGTGLAEEAARRLSQALLLGDFVKFARYQPTAEENQFSIEAVGNAIDELENETRREEAIRAQQELAQKSGKPSR